MWRLVSPRATRGPLPPARGKRRWSALWACYLPLSEPFILKDSVKIVIGPSSLEPHVLQEVPLPTHAHPLEQRHGRRVPTVRYGDDPMEPQGAERVIQQDRDSFRSETFPLVLPCQRKSYLCPVGFVLVDP